MDLLTGLVPLGLLLIFAVVVISRGLKKDTHNRDTSGGLDGGDAD